MPVSSPTNAASTSGTARANSPSRVPNRAIDCADARRAIGVGPQVRQHLQVEQRQRRRRRLGAVVVLLRPHEHRRVLARRAEPAAVDRIVEPLRRGSSATGRPTAATRGRHRPGTARAGRTPRRRSPPRSRRRPHRRPGSAATAPAARHPTAGREGTRPRVAPSPGAQPPCRAGRTARARSTRAARAKAAIIRPFHADEHLVVQVRARPIAAARQTARAARGPACRRRPRPIAPSSRRCRPPMRPCRAGSCR